MTSRTFVANRILTNRLIILTGVLDLFLTVILVPTGIFPHAFDKNTPIQFMLLATIATIFGFVIIYRSRHFAFNGKIIWVLWLTLITLFTSALLSQDFIGSLTGDTGRFTGVISTLCLVIVAIFHAGFSIQQFKRLATLYVFVIGITQVIGILHFYKVFDLPGGVGMVSTFGNLDFFAAYLGTTFPLLIFLMLSAKRNRRIVLVLISLGSISCIVLAGALQAYVDLAIAAFFVALFALRKLFPRRWLDFLTDLSLNVKTFALTLFIIIWAEVIFLMPFLGSSIPVLGSDDQVQIRGEFWLAGISQFIASPLFGVGPDQYGNHYEEFRTLDSAQSLQTVLANDAHSATVQTVATLGLVGTTLLTLLLAYLVRSLLIVAQRHPRRRRELLGLALFFFIYFTNAAISPITLPNKYLFWSVAGFVIGLVYRNTKNPANSLKSKFALHSYIGVSLIPIIFVAANFGFAQFRYLNWIEEFASSDATRVVNAEYSRYIPCAMYYNTLAKVINSQGNEALENFSKNQLKGNFRCVDAQINLAKLSYNKGDIEAMRGYVYELIELAPSREEVLTLARVYATKAGDKHLMTKVENQSGKFGILSIPVRPQGSEEPATSNGSDNSDSPSSADK
jgi:O-antigen ligase